MSKKLMINSFSVVFFAFICWIIFIADEGAHNFFIDGVRLVPYGDKAGHFFLYGLLAVSVSFSLAHKNKTYLGLPLGCALVLAFALIEELSQGFFPITRTLDIGDAVADCGGVYLANYLMGKIQNKCDIENELS